jgi:hypothetical protein
MASNRGVASIKCGEVQVRSIDLPKLVEANNSGNIEHSEITGEVIEAGRDVLFIREGDIVPMPSNLACGRCRLKWEAHLSAVRTLTGALLLSVAFSATALAQERAIPGTRLDEDALQLSSPLAQDIDDHLGAARGIEHELSLEQSRVNARSTSDIQQRQTTRDVQLSGQRLDTLKSQAPQARSIPLLERQLDRVNGPTGALSRDPGLEHGASTSLGLSGSIGGG